MSFFLPTLLHPFLPPFLSSSFRPMIEYYKPSSKLFMFQIFYSIESSSTAKKIYRW